MGQVYLTQPVDYEREQFYSFEVHAFDGIHVSEVAANITVWIVNVNEYSPEFVGQHNFELAENTGGRFHVEVVDRDSGTLGKIAKFTLMNAEDNYFSISPDGFIVNSVFLDYESHPHVHIVTVCAFDVAGRNACDIFTISLTDTNDNPPQFTKSVYSASIMEGTTVSSPVHVMATDRDITPEYRHIITFSWDSSSAHLASQYDITINQTSGVIMIGAAFNYERDPADISLTARASNYDGLSSTATVKILIQDRNEFHPQLSQTHYSIPVSEATPVDYILITFHASDEDGGPLYGDIHNYHLNSSDTSSPLPFMILANGNLVLKEILNYDTGIREFNFSITAIDGGGLHSPPASVTVTVQQSQNATPIFQPDQYIASVAGNSIPNEPLVNLQVVTDSVFTFFTILTDTEFSDHFSVTDNGSLFLVKSFDYEVIRSTTVKVSASDGILESLIPATVHVTVDPVNDNSPHFEVSHVTVRLRENLPQLSMEVRLIATDDDIDHGSTRHGTVTSYKLLTENVPFMLVNNPGERAAIITNSRPLDAEQDPAYYTLLIQAYDGEGMAGRIPAEVVVQVIDVDDNYPQFEQNNYFATLQENYQGVVTVITATDMDRDDENQRVSYTLTQDGGDYFQILSDGTVINRVAFDYEQDEPYHLITIQANDCNISQCQATVNITLVDTNDNIPEFSTQTYSFNISSDLVPSIGYVIGSVKATDADKSTRFGSVVDYRVKGSSGPFTVHATSGDIVIHNPYELRQGERIFNFEVIARDSGGQSATASVEINVPVFNSHPPIFERRLYYTSWEENVFNITLPE